MILCFSGNGNSRQVARRLAERLSMPVTMLTADTLTADFAATEAAPVVVWVLPVHSWGIPLVVKRWMESLGEGAFAAGAVHHCVLTCGDDVGRANRMWRRAIESHGWKAGRVWSVQMPNTYVLLPGFDVDSPELTERKLAAMPARVDAIADAIAANQQGPDDVVPGAFPGLKTRLIYPGFMRHEVKPAKFHVTDSCTGCGRCAATCPLSNITMVETVAGSPSAAKRHPRWGEDCTLCLGCYNVCPSHAVAYAGRTRGKGQYFLPANTPF